MNVYIFAPQPQTIGDNTMNFLEGLKIIWSDPEIRKTAIKSTVAAVAATGVATYAVTRAATRKQRKANEAYLAEPKTTMVDGELYKKMPDGTSERPLDLSITKLVAQLMLTVILLQ